MKSVKIKSLKIKEKIPVYDIEVPINHNFVLSNGVIAHNCSHSVSYSIIAYNCCYLKYHYPLYFWKGILTVFQDDFSKISDYLPECSEYIGEINVLTSDKFEWKIHNEKLIPPLSFVKGIGDKGVDTVLNVLKEAGLRNG